MKGVVALFAVLAVACATVAADAAARRPATLRLVDSSPITVRGMSFKARELVRVTFAQGVAKSTRTVRATKLGGFTASASDEIQLDRCGDLLLVTAVGGRRSRATLKYPLPDCPPAP